MELAMTKERDFSVSLFKFDGDEKDVSDLVFDDIEKVRAEGIKRAEFMISQLQADIERMKSYESISDLPKSNWLAHHYLEGWPKLPNNPIN